MIYQHFSSVRYLNCTLLLEYSFRNHHNTVFIIIILMYRILELADLKSFSASTNFALHIFILNSLTCKKGMILAPPTDFFFYV